ncbi:ankyrin [Gonapodya prolifera JEL478]|uniref:Ankyrin n=1 Tax=Gonapodya prolifera (strain JEL478) TaxID=1344416 RepID=A0A139APU2_GONPJ|nr:ankyrin [Gonapodya prolifera JEL478]|eukprot:KXS18756.1 ankyrin [Gonapodya prolifera JEL478]
MPSKSFPLLLLPSEIVILTSHFWRDHRLGLPTTALNRSLVALLNEPTAIAHRALQDSMFDSALIKECLRESPSLSVVRAILGLRKGTQPSLPFIESLCSRGDGSLSTIQLLIDEVGTDFLQNDCESVITAAASSGSLPLVKLLVENGGSFTPDCSATVMDGACKGGNLEVVRYLWDKGAQLDENTENDPVSTAIEGGHADILSFLLDRGVLETDDAKEWAISEAIDWDQIECIKVLVSSCDRLDDLATYLYTALRTDSLHVVNCFLDNGFPITNTLLDFATSVDATKELVRRGVDPKHQDSKVLQRAVEENNLHFVRYVLEQGVSVNNNDGKAVHAACTKGYLNILQVLLDSNEPLNETSKEGLLETAARAAQPEVVTHLLSRGIAGSTTQLSSALIAAVNTPVGRNIGKISGNVPATVKVLLNAGADVHVAGVSEAFVECCSMEWSFDGQSDLVSILLAAGVDCTTEGGKALVGACRILDDAIAEDMVLRFKAAGKLSQELVTDCIAVCAKSDRWSLFEYFVSVAGDQHHGAALRVACEANKLGCVRNLLAQGSVPSLERDSMLKLAAEHDRKEMVIVLAEGGASITGPPGSAALRAAAEYGNLDVMVELLKRGATMAPKWFDGPIRTARNHNRPDVAAFFLDTQQKGR